MQKKNIFIHSHRKIEYTHESLRRKIEPNPLKISIFLKGSYQIRLHYSETVEPL